MYYDGFIADIYELRNMTVSDITCHLILQQVSDAGLDILLSAESYLERGELAHAKYSLHTVERTLCSTM